MTGKLEYTCTCTQRDETNLYRPAGSTSKCRSLSHAPRPKSSGKEKEGRKGVSEACTDERTNERTNERGRLCGNEMSIWATPAAERPEREERAGGGAIVLPDIQRRLTD